MGLRVVFAEDNFLVREGTSALLAVTEDVELVASVGSPDELLRAVADHAPDAVLTDIRMPPTHTSEGITAAKRIRDDHPGVGVLVLSQYVEADYAFALLSGGAAGLGYLLKERISQVEELVHALHEVARGGSVLDPKVVERLLQRTSGRPASPLDDLGDRERAVLAEMACGATNAAIARRLFLSERAVEKAINTLFAKLGLGEEREGHRRVLAVLAYLRAEGQLSAG
ncbi:MAG TPA: response regulator transcription factor [Blastococcus sp.]|jgi:DNA-binding NarL/FixJ family response regulator|nr:response regulator transcription factor [Blastococcus sp.]